MTETAQTATFSEFARLAGFRRSYVTQLRKDGRLVLDDHGRIEVDATRDKIQQTADPSKTGVADRWAAHRAERDRAAPAVGAADTPETEREQNPSQPADRAEDAAAAGMTYQAARAVRERYLAMAAKRDYEHSMGKLLNAADTADACSNAVTILRTTLEAQPDTLAPQLAALTDEQQLRSVLAEHNEQMLAEIARAFAAVAGTAGAGTAGAGE